MGFKGFELVAQGESHIEKNLPCQDCAGHLLAGDYAVAAVADGHGGAAYFRSEIGSRLAVGIALAKLNEIMREHRDGFADLRNWGKNQRQLISSLIYQWRSGVEDHFLANPLTEEELAVCQKQGLNLERTASFYGTTLIMAVLTRKFGAALQIGDGAAVFLTDGEAENPVPADERLGFGLTTSMCDAEAIDNFRAAYREPGPEGILLSSDGFADSYGDDFLKIAREIILNMKMDFEKTHEELKAWLPVVSRKGSRDDLGLAGVFRTEPEDEEETAPPVQG